MLQELYFSCLAGQRPLLQKFLLILESGMMGWSGGPRVRERENTLASITERAPPFSLASWEWVCAWLFAMRVWAGHYSSLCWAGVMALRFVWGCFERLGCSCLEFPLQYVHLALLVMSWISYWLYCTVSLLHRILTALIIPLTIQLD